jgi:16S rRNA (cytosine967-C5)-methyltransferase
MDLRKEPRLHKNLVAAVIEALETSFGKGYYADKVIERLLKSNKKWGARDRGFIAESTYEIVRWWRLLWHLYGKEPQLKRKELYRLFGIWWEYQGYSLPDWPQFAAVKGLNLKERVAEIPSSAVGIQQSFPAWLNDLASEELGEEWAAVARALNGQAPVILRTNTLKISRDELELKLREEKIYTQKLPLNAIGLVLEKRQNTFKSKSFKAGFFEVQDGGSQLIAPFLKVQPGMRVIDACAGAGGKTLHLAALMENKGSITAMDVEERKLNELKKRAKRNGAHNIEVKPITSTKVLKRLQAKADRLLLDVPCSGTGVIKRNPDTKWKLQPEHLERVCKIQKDILQNYTKMLKHGGLVVYATCSILRTENEDQVAHFLAQNPEFNKVEEQRVNPTENNDGFYMALLQKSPA